MIALLAVLLATSAGAADLEIDGAGRTPTLTLSGNQIYDNVRIVNGGVLFIGGSGSLTITARSIFVDATSRIDGVGAGTPGDFGGAGPGLGGGGAGDGGGGGGHGGAGSAAFDATCTSQAAAGGAAFGLATDGISEVGGAGGGVNDGALDLAAGGAGGGSLKLDAEIVTIYGTLVVDGEAGVPVGWGGAGGGAGGSVLIEADFLSCYGAISALGGDGAIGLSPGGGGGGGLVEQRFDSFGQACPVGVRGGEAVCGDGAVGSSSTLGALDWDGDGASRVGGDCQTANPLVGLGIAETCDGIDQDCDGIADDGQTCGFVCVAFEGDGTSYLSCETNTAQAAAVTNCEGISGARYHLAVIDDDPENDAIVAGIGDIDDHWIAMEEPGATEDAWRWDAPVDSTYTNWSAGEPNDTNGEDCTAFRTAAGLWNDLDCGDAIDFLCERCELVTWYVDADGDGFGDTSLATEDCAYNPPANGVLLPGDCDDASASVWPGALELCDGVDSDCDGVGDPLARMVWADADGDGFGDPNDVPALLTCIDAIPGASVTNAADCDDSSSDAFPGGIELCNGEDDDCNGVVDDGDVCEGTPEACLAYQAEGSSYLACADTSSQPASETECAGFGYLLASLTTRPEDLVADALVDRVDPSATFWIGLEDPVEGNYVWADGSAFAFDDWNAGEPNNGGGGNQDCALTNDAANGAEDTWFDRECGNTGYYLCEANCVAHDWYADNDSDGWGDVLNTVSACAPVEGYVLNFDDCDDGDPLAHPNGGEIGDDGIDQDCDGFDACFSDKDLDGFGDADLVVDSGAVGCTDAGEADNVDDCDPAEPTINPGATEVAGSGTDDDCDGYFTCWYDGDGDGVGGAIALPSLDASCLAPYTAATNGDCDDADPSVAPGFTEVVGDGLDQDCDNKDSCWTDGDGDNFGSEVIVDDNGLNCDDGGPRTSIPGDCDDLSAQIFPGAVEIPADGLDSDCDGGDVCYLDDDGDGAAGLLTVLSRDRSCADPGEGVIQGEDCNDLNPNISPFEPEIVSDGLDQDCDGGDACYFDEDGDGIGGMVLMASADLDCTDPDESNRPDDCDDLDPGVSPLAAEITANDVDDDCDGVEICFLDSDGDGSGTPSELASADADCDDTDESYDDLDCQDGDPSIGPGAPEIPLDGIDQDCDGGDTCWSDADGDGFGAAVPLASIDLDCTDPGEATETSDCDDTQALAFPGGIEIVGDGIDQDCDGTENCPIDADGDGSGTPVLAPSADGDCADPGEATTTDDCDDGDDTVFPGAEEVPNDGLDQDCDLLDACFVDDDGDGFGDPAVKPTPTADADCLDAGESETGDDCDDAAAGVNPGEAEAAGNEVDENCDDAIDCFVDSDLDGFGADDASTAPSADDLCLTADGEALEASDCDDLDAGTNPAQVDVPNDTIDQDCSGSDASDADTDTDTDSDTDTDTDTDSDTDTDLPVIDDRDPTTDTPATTGEGCDCDSSGPTPSWLGAAGALVALLRRRRIA